MSRYRNNRFLSEYIKLDKECAVLLSIEGRGVTEYIARLSLLSDAEGKEQTLERLTKYRAYRNRLAHEVGALSTLSDVTREDVKWISEFIKKIRAHRDTLSRYERDRKKRSFGYKLGRALVITLISLTVIAAITVFAYLSLK